MGEIKQMSSCEREKLACRSVWLYREGGFRFIWRWNQQSRKRHISREQHVQIQGSLMECGSLGKLANARCGTAGKGQNGRLAQKWMDSYTKLEPGLVQWAESIGETCMGFKQENKILFLKAPEARLEGELVRREQKQQEMTRRNWQSRLKRGWRTEAGQWQKPGEGRTGISFLRWTQ